MAKVKLVPAPRYDKVYEEGLRNMNEGEVEANKDIPMGTCYPDSWSYLMRQDEGFLIHGSVQLLGQEGRRIDHAWVELPTGWIWEPKTASYFTIEDFSRMFSPIEDHKYSVEQAAIMLARVGHHGPWTEEEEAQWL